MTGQGTTGRGHPGQGSMRQGSTGQGSTRQGSTKQTEHRAVPTGAGQGRCAQGSILSRRSRQGTMGRVGYDKGSMEHGRYTKGKLTVWTHQGNGLASSAGQCSARQ